VAGLVGLPTNLNSRERFHVLALEENTVRSA
jgi:hypothetical protein